MERKDKKSTGFRTALNGYSREDVNRFIEEENRRFSELEDGYKKRLSEQEEQLRRLEQENTALREAPDASAAIQELEKARTELKESENLIGALHESLDQLLAEKDSLEQRLREAECPPAPEPSEPLQDDEKARTYDQISRQVGGMLLDAHAMADKIVGDARTQAEQLLSDSAAKSRTLSAEAAHRLRDMSVQCITEYVRYLNTAREALDRALSTVIAGSDGAQKKLDTLISSTRDGLDELFQDDSDHPS